jgi:hypothetical protein
MKVVTIVQMHARAHRVGGFTKSRVAETSQPTTELVGESTQKARRLPCLSLALSRHSKFADGLPLSVEKRSCSGHHCNDGI